MAANSKLQKEQNVLCVWV